MTLRTQNIMHNVFRRSLCSATCDPCTEGAHVFVFSRRYFGDQSGTIDNTYEGHVPSFESGLVRLRRVIRIRELIRSYLRRADPDQSVAQVALWLFPRLLLAMSSMISPIDNNEISTFQTPSL